MKEAKQKQLTRDELLVELTKVRQSHADWVSGDENRRKEFARAFGWNKPRRQFDYGDVELYSPTWNEIFVELGKLLAARNFMDFEGNLSELECKIEDVEKRIKSEIHPNF